MSSPQAFTNCVQIHEKDVLLTYVIERNLYHPEASQLRLRLRSLLA